MQEKGADTLTILIVRISAPNPFQKETLPIQDIFISIRLSIDIIPYITMLLSLNTTPLYGLLLFLLPAGQAL